MGRDAGSAPLAEPAHNPTVFHLSPHAHFTSVVIPGIVPCTIRTAPAATISFARVSPQQDRIAFLVTCAEDITPSSDPAWMRLFVDVDQNFKSGWKGYDLIINQTAPTAAGLSVTMIKDGKSTELPREPYSVKGAGLEIALPRSWFGSPPLRLDFKWADNQQKDGDIVEFALYGDSAPDRRFNYRYDETVTDERIRDWAEKAARPTK